MGARLFTAIVPPPALVEELDAFLVPRREAETRIRWTQPETWHLTTAFMAAVGDRHLDRLVEGLTSAASRTRPFGLQLGRGGVFGSPDAARHLWLGVTQGASDLASLAVRSRNAAGHAGVRTDGAAFTPHLTLARAHRKVDVRRLLTVLDTFDAPGWEATELLLIESHLTDRTNRYEIVERFPFSADTLTREPAPVEDQ